MFRTILYNIFFFLAIILILEIFLTFLPVNQSFIFRDVDKNNTIFRAKENRNVTQSRHWDLYNPQIIKINNFGFRNDQNYNINEKNIVSVIGDSYVEAVQVPFENTFYRILEKILIVNLKYTHLDFLELH